jgi:hypothetical protein
MMKNGQDEEPSCSWNWSVRRKWSGSQPCYALEISISTPSTPSFRGFVALVLVSLDRVTAARDRDSIHSVALFYLQERVRHAPERIQLSRGSAGNRLSMSKALENGNFDNRARVFLPSCRSS